MLNSSRLPLNEAETNAVEKLTGENPDANLSLTRRDPGETGPLLVHVGESTYQIDDAGHRRKVS